MRTLLDRLIQRGAVSLDNSRRPFYFSPLVSREQCVQAESDSLVERAFGGELASLILHLVKHERLKKVDIEKLKKILRDLEE